MSLDNQKVWTPTIAVTRTTRENILRYLFQNGRSSASEIRDALALRRTGGEGAFRSLLEYEFLSRTVSQGRVHYELTDRGRQFTSDELLEEH
ncbi:helix-turn-helix domain-containing protein [Natronolimnobius baerhuensis]|uniref:Transcriptional regulator n=1 Tax=Natronolimnobius baerhuensis TaxID=253108 RepID=A0A202ECG9_9EURY|nr:hypothetical protein [Natronolimnobius baerhuensis]OVE85931.1 hypothetical protein B2G88_03730 [Natronolimnobius baerhuensis]